MQHLQQQKDEGSAHQEPPLYIAASCGYCIDEEVFEKGSPQSIYFLCMSGILTNEFSFI